jgi:hypothetical protein
VQHGTTGAAEGATPGIAQACGLRRGPPTERARGARENRAP